MRLRAKRGRAKRERERTKNQQQQQQQQNQNKKLNFHSFNKKKACQNKNQQPITLVRNSRGKEGGVCGEGSERSKQRTRSTTNEKKKLTLASTPSIEEKKKKKKKRTNGEKSHAFSSRLRDPRDGPGPGTPGLPPPRVRSVPRRECVEIEEKDLVRSLSLPLPLPSLRARDASSLSLALFPPHRVDSLFPASPFGSLLTSPMSSHENTPPTRKINTPSVYRHRTFQPVASSMPSSAAAAFVAPSATVAGNVRLGDRVSVWFGAVIRGTLKSLDFERGNEKEREGRDKGGGEKG